ncbi:MAG: BBP7 family outer membrane beta-barrel protein [Gemmataceae bacterium]|nr:BBP7 family outer membrane beta-barrel protein [Gemmataceae bacterium]
MKRVWLSGLCVWAGWFVGAARGQEGIRAFERTPAGMECSAPGGSPRTLPLGATEGQPLSRSPGVALGTPRPLGEVSPASGWRAAHPDGGVIPTSFRPAPLATRAKLLDGPPGERIAAPKGAPPAAAPKGVPPAGAPAAPCPAPTMGHTPFAADRSSIPFDAAELIPPPPQPVASDEVPFVVDEAGRPVEGEVIDGGSGPFRWDSFRPQPGRFYASAEFLMWWIQGQRTPPLVTTSPPETPQAIEVAPGQFMTLQGVLGQPTTTVLFGGDRLNQGMFPGGRFRAGYWLDDCHTCGIDVGGFFLARRSDSFAASSPGTPVIARPFIARTPNGQAESAELTASPGSNPGDLFSLSGNIRVNASTRFWGAEANVRHLLCCGCDWRLEGLLGYRYLGLDEDLSITEDVVLLRPINIASGALPAGTRVVIADRFETSNQFHGGQVGVSGEWQRGRWFVGGTVKVALGNMHQTVDINGHTTIAPPGGPRQDFAAGLLAVGSNSGSFSRDRFAVVPEVGLKVGFQLTDSLRAWVGYDFLYVSSVVRPGDQIDRVIDVNQIPIVGGPAPAPPARPLVPFRATDFWAQGLNLGVEWRY